MSTWAETYEKVHEVIASASGLNASRVFWRDQDINQPDLDYITIALTSCGALSNDVKPSTDLNRPVGEEVKLEIIGTEEVMLEVQVFTSAKVPEVGKRHALEIASTIRAKLWLVGVRQALREVQFVPIDPQPVRWVPEVVQVRFRGRAVLECMCYMPPINVFEYAGYIASISGTVTAKQPDGPDLVRGFVAPDAE